MTTQSDAVRQARTIPHNLDVALAHAQEGIPVFPCQDGSTRDDKGRPIRAPLVKWQDAASKDPETIRKWWTRWPDAVPGIPTGKASGLAVLDLDRKGGKDGVAAIEALGFIVPEGACVVDTPSGGQHVYFEHVEGVTNAARHLPEGVDVRGEGGFVFAPGAVDNRDTYRPRGDFAVSFMLGFPTFPPNLRPEARPADDQVVPAGELDRASALSALRAIPCDGSHDDWNRVLMAFHQATGGDAWGLAQVQAWSSDYPGWNPKEVATKWSSYGRRDGPQVGAGTLFKIARDHGWRESDIADVFADLPNDEAAEPDLSPFMPSCEAALGPQPPYLLKGLAGQGQAGAILGAPGVGKSFLAALMAHCIATGREFFGRRVRAARTAYLSAEDPHGMECRIRGLCEEYGPAPDLVLGRTIPNLRNKDEVETLRLALRRDKVRVVFIDTLAAAMPGLEENDAGAGGMGAVVALIQRLRRDGLAVILVHHTAKASDGSARGHSSLQGILDFTIPLRISGDVVTSTLPAKNRSGLADHAIAFIIRGVDLDLPPDEDGEPIRSAICVPCPVVGQRGPKLTAREAAALALMTEMAGESCEVKEPAFRAAALARPDICGDGKPKSRATALKRGLATLKEASLFHRGPGVIRLGRDMASLFADLEGEE